MLHGDWNTRSLANTAWVGGSQENLELEKHRSYPQPRQKLGRFAEKPGTKGGASEEKK